MNICERKKVWRGNTLWSVVMMMDCAASGAGPRRAAASATISNAILKETGV